MSKLNTQKAGPTPPRAKRTAAKAGRPRSVESHQAILEATRALLMSEGFEAMSIEAIAAKAGVGKKTIYRWWTSKESLVIDAIKSLQQAQNPVVDTGSFRDDLASIAKNTFRMFSNPDVRSLAINLAGVMTRHRDVYQAFYNHVIAPRFEQAAQMIERAQARGEIRGDLDAGEVIGFVAGPVWYRLFSNARSVSLSPEMLERMMDVAFHGIEAREAPRVRGAGAARRDARPRRKKGEREGG